MFKRNYRMQIILVVIVLLLACAPLATPIPPPTYDLLLINTAIAWTAEAAATQTALMIPPTLTATVTLFPTRTPPPTESPTPTFIFILPTSTVPSSTPTATPDNSGAGSEFACRVDSQSPSNNTAFAAGESFDAHWWVTNIGTEMWDRNSSDYRYSSGDAIHKTEAYDLQRNVQPGKQGEIVVDMKAPSDPGTYSTAWKIRIGGNEFCTMSLSIVVN